MWVKVRDFQLIICIIYSIKYYKMSDMIFPDMIILLHFFRFCSENFANPPCDPDTSDFRFFFSRRNIANICTRACLSLCSISIVCVNEDVRMWYDWWPVKAVNRDQTPKMTTDGFTLGFPGVVSYNLTRNSRKDRTALHSWASVERERDVQDVSCEKLNIFQSDLMRKHNYFVLTLTILTRFNLDWISFRLKLTTYLYTSI